MKGIVHFFKSLVRVPFQFNLNISMMNVVVSLVGVLALAGTVSTSFSPESSAGFEVLYSKGDF